MSSKKLKICFISNVRIPGEYGPPIRTMEIAKALALLGHEVHLFAHLGKDLPHLCNLHFHSYSLLLNPFRLRKNVKLIKKLDVIYERFSFLYCNVGAFFSWITKRPLVYEFHESPVMAYHQIIDKKFKWFWKLDYKNPLPIILCSFFPLELLLVLENKILKFASLIIVPVQKLKNSLVQRGVMPKRIFLIPNAVDVKCFSPKVQCIPDLASSADKLIFVFSTNLAPSVFETIVKTARLLKDEPLKFLFVGEVDKYAFIRRVITYKKLSNIILYGSVPHDTIPKILATSDVFLALYSSKVPIFKTGFYFSPIKIYELLSMGKPLIVTKIDELEEEFKGANIFFTEMDNPYDLAEKIEFVVANQREMEEWSRKNRDFILRRHTWNERAKKLTTLLGGIVNQR